MLSHGNNGNNVDYSQKFRMVVGLIVTNGYGNWMGGFAGVCHGWRALNSGWIALLVAAWRTGDDQFPRFVHWLSAFSHTLIQVVHTSAI